jgi:hypothetical protein
MALAPAAGAQQVVPMPDTLDAIRQAEGRPVVAMPDARDAAEPPKRLQDLRMPDTRDSAEGRGGAVSPVVEFVEVKKPDRFDWADAGLGAASGIGLVLIGAGTALTAGRMRRRSAGTVRA